MTRGTRKFDGLTYYLVERELTKTAAQMEAKRLRKGGKLARITQLRGTKIVKALGRFAVWARNK